MKALQIEKVQAIVDVARQKLSTVKRWKVDFRDGWFMAIGEGDECRFVLAFNAVSEGHSTAAGTCTLGTVTVLVLPVELAEEAAKLVRQQEKNT